MYTKKNNTSKLWYKHNAKKYIISLNPGKPHKLSIPLGLILKQIINEPTSKIRKIIRQAVLVNNKKVNSINYPVMLLDLIKYNKDTYRVKLIKRLVLEKENSEMLFLRIDSFKKYNETKYQLNLHNGFNILVDEKPVLKFIKYNIITKNFEYTSLNINDKVIVTKGKYLGQIYTCKSIIPLILNAEKDILLNINQVLKIE